VKIGLDYWHVCSDHPGYFAALSRAHLWAGDEVHVISAIGRSRSGTILAEVHSLAIPYTAVHEVVFMHPRESPRLKLAKCLELGITVYYDDRDDVCRLLAGRGILALRVTREEAAGDVAAERDGD
jgi:hypothetical protein